MDFLLAILIAFFVKFFMDFIFGYDVNNTVHFTSIFSMWFVQEISKYRVWLRENNPK